MRLAAEKIMFGHIGIIHFVGIGGIGMSGIAEILHNLGYQVQGSDAIESYVTKNLAQKGIKVFIGHAAENVKGVSIVVRSSAIGLENSEIKAAIAAHIMVIKRSEMLGELMRLKISIAISGTHGKTTTTSLIAAMFEKANLDPTVINGGIVNARGTNAYLGKGDFLIAEADESDETFIKIPSTIGVITNIDPEHLNHYGNFDNLKQAFRTFINNLPFYGFGVLCKDHAEVFALSQEILDRRILTYGIDTQDVNVRAINIVNNADSSDFDVLITASNTKQQYTIKGIHLPMVGLHNVLNSLAAIAIGVELKFSDEVIKNAFVDFKGVKRRFTRTGIVNDITIVDDYAHHPAEIVATLKTAKLVTAKTTGRIIAVVQPHRYSRVNDCFSEFTNCFGEADIVIIADIYAAGEQPIEGISRDILVNAIKQLNYCNQVMALEHPQNLAQIISSLAKPNDLVLFMGAGNITNWAYDLPNQLSLLIKGK
jgi:UDP-N-acetylmuramate--alanine ligase